MVNLISASLLSKQSGVSKMERRLVDTEARIEGMFKTMLGALVKSGMLSEEDAKNAEALQRLRSESESHLILSSHDFNQMIFLLQTRCKASR